MKKKVLSLLMAAAVVATTAIPAHAQTYEANDTETIDANVTVTGTVSTVDGIAPSGKIQVEVPTTLSFTVDQASNFKAPTYTIANKSSVAVSVSVGSFKETDVNGGITLHETMDSPESLDRANVKLTLKGNTSEVNLANVNTNEVISVIAEGNSDTIQLLGQAGTATQSGDVDDNGASEDFNLVFKIKKHN
ncbi:MAG: hypothetical protein HUJ77_09315 [Clostridium sp.]|uniref:hypothetical protein n=1 Tax=Clostridium sp. TaxID=1506 RepID=UPI0025C431D8|nr:hypothetical protein [Clostridium sp.]MCF0148583.1 hypothetical protein [Clostridium sp.]